MKMICSGAAFSHDSVVLQCGALSTAASSYHMNTLENILPSSDKREIFFSIFLSLLHEAVLMTVWEGGEADLCPWFLISLYRTAGLVRWIASAAAWEGRWRWRRNSHGQSDLFIKSRDERSTQSTSMDDFSQT